MSRCGKYVGFHVIRKYFEFTEASITCKKKVMKLTYSVKKKGLSHAAKPTSALTSTTVHDCLSSIKLIHVSSLCTALRAMLQSCAATLMGIRLLLSQIFVQCRAVLWACQHTENSNRYFYIAQSSELWNKYPLIPPSIPVSETEQSKS